MLEMVGLIASIPEYFKGLAQLHTLGIRYVPPAWTVIYTPVIGVISIVALYGIWQWKQWGAYLLFASIAVSLFETAFLIQGYIQFPPHISKQGIVLYTELNMAVEAGLWFWAVYRKWKYFE